MLYVDGYTGSMRVARNAVVGANAHQGFMLCNWYGHSTVSANVLQLGDAAWGADYELSVNCDGNPVIDARANLVLSDESSGAHQPDAAAIAEYGKAYATVCAATARAASPAPGFLDALDDVIAKLGGERQRCV